MLLKMRLSSFIRVGSQTLDLVEQLFGPSSLRSYLAEFISTFIYVFAGVGSSISAGKLVVDPSAETSLVDIALAHAFALTVATYVATSISGGHINPAVTFGFIIEGHISILNGICYCVAQLLGSTIACLFLTLVASGQAIPTHGLADGVNGFVGLAIETIATFILVYTVCAVKDPNKGSSDGMIGSIAIGFMVGANILAIGAFTGASMNPARSFGPAIITGDFKNHGIYWLGPMIGGGLAGLVYPRIMSHTDSITQSSLNGEIA
ncbi:Aquaporin tip2-1 [Thalictrum thalictroides]|uniref:Aquaporin tip2-1 n=1 Tax=Thalictrum thalictroides TaxID=46969 RepID=A0A7J6WCU3_THATH|nr:Aquaporin tip2-1 [Thalictrum thalictroides]